MSGKRSKLERQAEKEAEKRRKQAQEMAQMMGPRVEVFSFSQTRDSSQHHQSEWEGVSDMSPFGEMDSAPSSPRREVVEQVVSLDSAADKDDDTIYLEAILSLFSQNDSEPPFLKQAPTNSIASAAWALPGWDDANRTIRFEHFCVAGFAKVAVHSAVNSEDEQTSEFVFFCDCCEQGQQAWHEVELFHDECGMCTLSSPCIHARYLKKLVVHLGGYSNVILYYESTISDPGVLKRHRNFFLNFTSFAFQT